MKSWDSDSPTDVIEMLDLHLQHSYLLPHKFSLTLRSADCTGHDLRSTFGKFTRVLWVFNLLKHPFNR